MINIKDQLNEAERDFVERLSKIAMDAERFGWVVESQAVPLQPFEMGNVQMVYTVRHARRRASGLPSPPPLVKACLEDDSFRGFFRHAMAERLGTLPVPIEYRTFAERRACALGCAQVLEQNGWGTAGAAVRMIIDGADRGAFGGEA